MRARTQDDKDRLRDKISEAQEQIEDTIGDAVRVEGAIDWRVEFAEVMGDGGFDIVVANPPYVQLQREGGRLGQLYRNVGYQTFVRTGDIYYLFYERGVNLAKQNTGQICYISSNQWMRVNSGRVLRKFFESQNPLRLINLGAGVFDSATVNTCVVMVRRAENENILQAANVSQSAQQFPPSEWTHTRSANGETWVVLSNAGQRIKDKMEAVGTPLKDWDVSIKYGVKTGYNKAFIIDTATKDALIVADSRSAEIVKPILRGRDIQRYRAQWAGLWLLNIPWHFPLHLDSTVKGASSAAEASFQDQYPAVYEYLFSHKAGLTGRNKSETGIRYEWFALQRWGSNYYEDFSQEKIVWGNLNNRAKYSYAPKNMYISAPTTMMTPYSPYLLAVLNSTLADWYFRLIGVERDGGYYEYKPMFIERLPIPKISAAEQRPLIALVDEIIAAKAADLQADTDEYEWKIDRLVYNLYGLTEEEDTTVERSLGLIHQTDEEEDADIARAIDEALAEEGYASEEEVMAILLRAGDAD